MRHQKLEFITPTLNARPSNHFHNEAYFPVKTSQYPTIVKDLFTQLVQVIMDQESLMFASFFSYAFTTGSKQHTMVILKQLKFVDSAG